MNLIEISSKHNILMKLRPQLKKVRKKVRGRCGEGAGKVRGRCGDTPQDPHYTKTFILFKKQ